MLSLSVFIYETQGKKNTSEAVKGYGGSGIQEVSIDVRSYVNLPPSLNSKVKAFPHFSQLVLE